MIIKGIPVCLRALIMHCDFIYKGPLALDKALIFYIEINNTNALCNKSMQFNILGEKSIDSFTESRFDEIHHLLLDRLKSFEISNFEIRRTKT